ncbi:MAG: tripartite tricarboxylate transporter substrate binding protein [Alphaproteobacteria bacterium]|nr:tripartite tricarboxylate transporter substrate binding protein [Alphaproteobacteria bacterium]
MIARALLGLLVALLPAATRADDWPVKPIRLIIPYAAGGPVDVAARIVGDKLAERFKARVLLDNRPGAGGNIGVDIVAKSPPDGYALLFTTSSVTIAPSMYKTLPYDLLRDFAPISQILTQPTTLIALPSFAPKTIAELITLARAEPGTVTYASGGNGTTNHLSGEMLKALAKIDIVHVPYRGTAPAMTALLGGEVKTMFASTIESLPSIKDGRVKALAVTNAQRTPLLPDVPTIGETLPGYDCTIWYGLWAPAGLPASILTPIAETIAALPRQPDVVARFDAFGATVVASAPEAFAAHVRAEVAKWRALTAAAGIQPE